MIFRYLQFWGHALGAQTGEAHPPKYETFKIPGNLIKGQITRKVHNF
jgi:hypothetical protein